MRRAAFVCQGKHHAGPRIITGWGDRVEAHLEYRPSQQHGGVKTPPLHDHKLRDLCRGCALAEIAALQPSERNADQIGLEF